MVTDTIKKVANAILDAGEGCQSGLVYVDPVEAAKAAIAALLTGAEPVAFTDKDTIEILKRDPLWDGGFITGENHPRRIALYAAPPAPSVAVKELPLAAIEKRDVDEVDVTGLGVLEGHAIPVAVARKLAARINLCICSALSAQVQDVAECVSLTEWERNKLLNEASAKLAVYTGHEIMGMKFNDREQADKGKWQSLYDKLAAAPAAKLEGKP